MKSKRAILLATALAVVMAGGGFAAGREAQAPVSPTTESAQNSTAMARSKKSSLPSFADLAARVSPTVVNIKVLSVEKTAFPDQLFGKDFPFPGFQSPIPQQRQQFTRQGTGSGFIIRKDGLILTNNHVIEDAQQITVTLSNKRRYKAKVLGRDSKTDLAVLKIDAKASLPVAVLGDSNAVRVGDWVMAIGNPFGLTNTVTSGIVSAKGRMIGSGPYDDFIQTDAPINPGNSGGPLFNLQGQVIGINSAIYSQSGGNIGIGFAVPINLAKSLLPQLETKGRVTRGWLGVSIQPVTQELARSFNLPKAQGALVGDVIAASPADKAGIKRGDVIVSFNGKEIKESSSLPALVASVPAGKTVPVEVIRKGNERTIEVAVGKLQERNTSAEAQQEKTHWGLTLRDIQPQERQQMNLKENQGVLVAAVEPGSAAADAGVQPGDVILQVNRASVKSVENVKEEINKTRDGKPLLLLLRRVDGSTMFAALSSNVG